jgi:hypothetical protein
MVGNEDPICNPIPMQTMPTQRKALRMSLGGIHNVYYQQITTMLRVSLSLLGETKPSIQLVRVSCLTPHQPTRGQNQRRA